MGKWNATGFPPTQFREKFGFGVNFPCASTNLNFGVSLTIAIMDRLEKSVCLLIKFCSKSRERSVACTFEALANVYLETLRLILRRNYSEAEQ